MNDCRDERRAGKTVFGMGATMDDFDYDLPESLIAQTPIEPRDSARMLVALDTTLPPTHSHVSDLPSLLNAGDVLVINTTKVLPARIAVLRETGGGGEVLLLDPVGDCWWNALARPSKKLPPGTLVMSANGDLRIEMGDDFGDGRRRVKLEYGPGAISDATSASTALAASGTMPLPPYIHERLDDQSRYQTVYAQQPGSAAAPTAGLHFTPSLLDELRRTGVVIAEVELVVGLDTFRPVTAAVPQDHVIHTERYRVPAETIDACRTAKAHGHRVIAVGTTTTRALESAAATGELDGHTNLFIHGSYRFAVVDIMMTNFHLPRSSLLLLIDAFGGPRWRDLYSLAQAEGYRFLSFGDCMLLGRQP